MKNIAIDVRSICGNRAGKGQYTFYLVKELIKQDKSNRYLLYTNKYINDFDSYDNVEVKVLKKGGLWWHFFMAKECKKLNIDIFWSPTSYITPFFINKKTKTITTVHDLVTFFHAYSHNKKAYWIEKFFLRIAVKKSYRVITVSEYTKSDLLKLFPNAKEKTEVVYCAANPNYEKIEVDSDDKFFLAIGTIQPRKNYEKLIDAFAGFAGKFKDIKLIIVGKNGWNYESVYKKIEDNKLKSRIEVLGYTPDEEIVKLYNSATALVFPSFYEGFGMPPIEAMACGCPVIASNASCIPEIVGNAALLVNPQSSKEIHDSMVKLWTDENLRNNLIAAGEKRSKEFTWKKSAKKLLKLIK